MAMKLQRQDIAGSVCDYAALTLSSAPSTASFRSDELPPQFG